MASSHSERRLHARGSTGARGGTWFDAAGEMVEGLDGEAARDLLATMVHASPAPEGTTVWDWRLHTQVAAAMGLAWLPGGADAAMTRLRDLVDGQVDWTCTAALVVLTEIAQRSARHVEPIAQLFEGVYALEVCPIVHMCLRQPVADLALQLPDRSPELLALWRARRAESAA